MITPLASSNVLFCASDRVIRKKEKKEVAKLKK